MNLILSVLIDDTKTAELDKTFNCIDIVEMFVWLDLFVENDNDISKLLMLPFTILWLDFFVENDNDILKLLMLPFTIQKILDKNLL